MSDSLVCVHGCVHSFHEWISHCQVSSSGEIPSFILYPYISYNSLYCRSSLLCVMPIEKWGRYYYIKDLAKRKIVIYSVTFLKSTDLNLLPVMTQCECQHVVMPISAYEISNMTFCWYHGDVRLMMSALWCHIYLEAISSPYDKVF